MNAHFIGLVGYAGCFVMLLVSCGKRTTASPSALVADVARYGFVRDPYRDYLGFLYVHVKADLLSDETQRGPIGGIFERILFREESRGEVGLFVRHSADFHAEKEEHSPPVPEGFRCYAFDQHRKLWKRNFLHEYDVVYGRIQWKNFSQNGTTYMLRSYQRGSRPRLEAFGFNQGERYIASSFEHPSNDEEREKSFELSEEGYRAWVKKATALPEGMEPFDPDRQWITLAELIRSKNPKWHAGAPPTEEAELTKLRESAPAITPDEFKAWWSLNEE